MALIVIHANYNIVLTTFILEKSCRVEMALLHECEFFCCFNRWNNFVDLFGSKQSILPA